MQQAERRAVFSLSLIMIFRLLGLFMILPVFSLYITRISSATPALIGVALGIYGLTQAILQIPFGLLSDHWGRKPIIAMGLCLFAIGSVVAALSHSIYPIIIGRALQGAGAIGSTVLATVADLTRDEERSKAMAFIGLSIGLAFVIAMIMGPALNAWIHLQGIFWVTALLALIGLCIVFTIVPTPSPQPHAEIEPEKGYFHAVLRNRALWQLNGGIFALHAILTALFVGIPLLLSHHIALNGTQQIFFYLVVMLLSFSAVLPIIVIAEKNRQLKSIFIAAITALIICFLCLLWLPHTLFFISPALFLFFVAFTFLEASLPSWVSKISPIHQKGTAMGIYSSSQFLGIFVGGSFGGWVLGHYQQTGIFIFCTALACCWLLIALCMAPPPYLSTVILSAPLSGKENRDRLKQQLKQLPGVAEVALMTQDNLIYAKIDKKIISEDELRKQIRESTLELNI